MSITYLQDPNGYLEIADVYWLGQTVTLDVTTRIYNFYFESWRGSDRNDILCDVYLTDESHHPTGSPIASSKEVIQVWEKSQRRDRDCFVFRDLTMEAGVEYFFLIYDKSSTLIINTRIYARKDDSIFEDGMLYYSDNAGATWTEYPNDDMIFALTGIPEIPPQPPDPPIKNFAILDLEQKVTSTGIEITVTTNVPCHLYCYWTATEPEKHLIPILTRGIELHTRLKMCFVNWNENEQEEPFDTLTHTFTKEPWAVCETRWVTFRAKVMDEWVKSVGPIFKKHRVEPEEPTEMEFAAGIESGHHNKYSTSWYTAWSSPTGAGVQHLRYHECRARRPGVGSVTISRGILRFDTSPLPDDCEIESATLKIAFFRNAKPAATSSICFVPGVGCGDEMVPEDYGALRENTDWVCDSIPVPPLLLDTYYEKDIYQAQLGIISKTGQTRIGLRGVRDIDNLQPSTATELWISFYGVYYEPTPNMDARLIVRYL